MTMIAVENDKTASFTAALQAEDELAKSVFINGSKVAIVPIAPTGTVCTAHDSPKPAEPAEGSSSVFIEGRPVHRAGDARNASCGKATDSAANLNKTVFAHQ